MRTTSIKHRIVWHSFVVALSLVAASSAIAESPKSILFYGNSFTLGIGSSEAQLFGGVPEVVKQLAVAAGFPEPKVEDAAVSGQTFAWHLGNNLSVIGDPVDFAEFPDHQWDVVVLQEFSTNPTHIGDPAGFRADAVTLFDEVQTHSPGVLPVLYETWARAPGHSYYTGGAPSFPGGPAQMQQELRDNYELARQDLDAWIGDDVTIVARVGDSWEATGWDDLHSTDLYHANSRGTYLAGLIIFGTIYHQPTTIGLPRLFASLSDPEAAALQAIADGYLPPFSPFDTDFDGDIDRDDYPDFEICALGPGVVFGMGHACLAFDDDADGAVGLADFAAMQAQAFAIPPTLCFTPASVTFSLAEGAPGGSAASVMTSDAGSPTIALSALDVVTQAAPTWLTVPTAAMDGVEFDIDVDATTLGVGLHYARVTASAAGYTAGSMEVTLAVLPATTQVWVDFGSSAITTDNATPHFNNVHTSVMTASHDLLDAGGLPTGITLQIDPTLRFNGSNTSGTLSPTPGTDLNSLGLPATAIQDSLFGNDVTFSGGVFPTALITLSGLNPSDSYDLTFAASRLGVGDVRTTDYEVAGATTVTATLDAANNESEVAVVNGISPDAGGELVITVTKSASNTNSTGFYYLGVLKLERVGA